MIDLKEILINSNYKKETEELINIANLAYKHWETYWTGFNSTYVCEEILKDFENLNDFKFFIYGGFSSSQRSRIACFRGCLLYTSPSPRDISGSRMPSSA